MSKLAVGAGKTLTRMTSNVWQFFGGAVALIGLVMILMTGDALAGIGFVIVGAVCFFVGAKNTPKAKTFLTLGVIVFSVMLVAVPQFVSFAQEEITLDIDMEAFFTQINVFLPIAFAIFAIPIGLVVAFVLVRFIGNALIRAFQGREL